MGKTKKRQIDDTEYFALIKEIKDLKTTIKALERKIQTSEKSDKKTKKQSKKEKSLDKDPPITVPTNSCPSCNTPSLVQVPIGDTRTITKCSKCTYRKTIIHG